MRRLILCVPLFISGCAMDNPAFEREGASTDKPGDGDPGDGDPGDGDPGDGDPGDGDPGDGDPGDGDPGDGDPGDGDPGDGDPGDGDPGDGDGDGDPIGPCDPGDIGDPYEPFVLNFVSGIDITEAPEFATAPAECHSLVICQLEQEPCDLQSAYLARIDSGGLNFAVLAFVEELVPIKLVFQPGPTPCGEPLAFFSQQAFKLDFVAGDNIVESIEVRLPCSDGDGPTLFVGADGSTFWDPELLDPAALW